MQGRKIKDFFSGDRKNLYMILSIMIVSIFTLSVAYAVLSTTLNITGSTEISSASWDIHLEKVQVKHGSVEANKPEITGTSSVSFDVDLALPGDFYEFTVDVVNDGSIDAMIDSVVKTPELTADQAKYIKYEITYQSGASINEKQLLKKETTTPIKVRIEYRKDLSASDLPSTTTELSLGLTLIYVQSDGSGSEILNNGKLVNILSGDGTQVGDEICIKEECFYVISSTGGKFTMLAKYNLYVGGSYDESTNLRTAYGDEATGRQDSTSLGYIPGYPIRKSVVKFSDTKYWRAGTSNNYNNCTNTTPTYKYDSNSVLYSYVENYKTYLSTLGVTPSDAKLINYHDLVSLGCDERTYSCSSAPEWVYATSYWTGSVCYDYVWNITNGRLIYSPYTSENYVGVRPVIIVPQSVIYRYYYGNYT